MQRAFDVLLQMISSHFVGFLPAAKRHGHAELWLEKKETYGFWFIAASLFDLLTCVLLVLFKRKR